MTHTGKQSNGLPHPGPVSPWWCGKFGAATIGFGVGIVTASSYLILGGDYVFFIPRWAEIAFYPGFVAGYQAYGWGLSEDLCKIVGVLAVGFAYAAIALFVRWAWRAVRRRKSNVG